MQLRCLADMSGPFFDPEQPFRNWSAFPYYQTDCAAAPYVDLVRLGRGLQRAKAHLHRLHSQGYNGIVIDNLAHLVGFEQAPVLIYAADCPFRRRALIYRATFGELFAVAASLGMEVFVTADMQWSTPPLRRVAGPLRATNRRLAAINRWALSELFSSMPQVRGLVIRVGEAGGAHNLGSDYEGHMIYTSPATLRGLIDQLLPVCEQFDRLLVVRSWSIGIGELGDLLWSPERYRETFAGYHSPNLIVSVKHGPSDFFRFLPPNPTLGLPGPPQLVELQNRREYELFGMVPSSVAELHQAVIQYNREHNRSFAGIWAWNSTGGWGGGTAALGADGWSFWTELSSALTAALFQQPALDSERFVRCWCAERLAGRSEAFVTGVADLYLASGRLFEQGWYGGAPPAGPRNLGGIYLPPLLWVWWMRPTASLLIWAYLAATISDQQATLQVGAAACIEAAAYADRLAELAPPADRLAAELAASARYLAGALELAQALRVLLLPLLGAAWAGRRPDAAWLKPRLREATMALARHRAAWAGRADLPPLELDEMAALLSSLRRTPGLVWGQACLACELVRRLQARRGVTPRLQTAGAIAAAALLGSLVARRGRLGLAGALASLLLITPLRRRLIGHAMPWLNQHLRLLPSIFFEAGPAFIEWAS